MRKVRWIKTSGKWNDQILFETEDGILLSKDHGPAIIIVAGEYRIYLEGEEILEKLTNVIECARIDHANFLTSH